MNESCNSCEKRLTCKRYVAMTEEERGDMRCSKYSAEQKPKEDKPKFPTVEEVMRDKEYYSNYMIPLRELKCIKYE